MRCRTHLDPSVKPAVIDWRTHRVRVHSAAKAEIFYCSMSDLIKVYCNTLFVVFGTEQKPPVRHVKMCSMLTNGEQKQ